MESDRTRVAFVQAFGLNSPGGGPRILRALLKNAPVPWTSFCTYPEAPPKAAFGVEEHVPIRPWFGRIERTRFSWMPNRLEPLFARRFEQKLELRIKACGATVVHSIPHGLDFIHGYRIARRLGLKFFLNVHDDVRHTAARVSGNAECLTRLDEIWKNADGRLVISEQLGDEYCRRHGQRPYEVITDGIESLSKPRERPEGVLRIYFMGLFHIRYEPNLRALLDAIESIRNEHAGLTVSAVFRCGSVRSAVTGDFQGMKVLPFGNEADVEADMREADLLYLPLPFNQDAGDFVRYSLSTKMITYLRSGLPILYHGPELAAAYSVLSESDAAFRCCALEPNALAGILRRIVEQRTEVAVKVENSLALAERRFLLKGQRQRFWDALTREEKPQAR